MLQEIRPQPGVQEHALACTADIAIIGGAAGCGKTWCSVVEPLRWIQDPKFRAIIFRRTHPQLIGAGSVWEQSESLYPYFGAKPNHGKLLWTFPSGATVKLSHLQHDKNKLDHQGKEYSLIIFEEGTHFTETQFWYLLSRARTLAKMDPYVRVTCNPDPDSFLAPLVSYWIKDDGYVDHKKAGKLRWFVRTDNVIHWHNDPGQLRTRFPDLEPLSLTYIPGMLEENKILMASDPRYKARIESLPFVERMRVKGGNWKIRETAGTMFNRSMFTIVDKLPAEVVQLVRFWDKAATPKTVDNNPSATAGVKFAKLANGQFAILHIERFYGSPGTVDRRMSAIANQDSQGNLSCSLQIRAFQDPGQAGVVDRDHMKQLLQAYDFDTYKVGRDKISMASPVSALAEHRGILLLKGAWNESFLDEICDFPSGKNNDQVDALSGAYQIIQSEPLVFY